MHRYARRFPTYEWLAIVVRIDIRQCSLQNIHVCWFANIWYAFAWSFSEKKNYLMQRSETNNMIVLLTASTKITCCVRLKTIWKWWTALNNWHFSSARYGINIFAKHIQIHLSKQSYGGMEFINITPNAWNRFMYILLFIFWIRPRLFSWPFRKANYPVKQFRV